MSRVRLLPATLLSVVSLSACGTSGEVATPTVTAPAAVTAATPTAAKPTFTEVALDPDGKRVADPHGLASMSANGRKVAFVDMSNHRIYVRDVRARSTRRVATCASGTDAFYSPLCSFRLSADGRYLVFTSSKALVPADANREVDVYRMNLTTREIVLASVGGGSRRAAGGVNPSISADGSIVSFSSPGDLDPARPNPKPNGPHRTGHQIFVRNLAEGTTTLASRDAAGKPGDRDHGEFTHAELSPDGNWIAFKSHATNFGPGTGELAAKDLRTDDSAFQVGARIGYELPRGNYFGSFSAPTDDGRMAVYVKRPRTDGDGPFDGPIDDRRTIVVDLPKGKIVRTVVNLEGRPVRSADRFALSADGRTLVFGYRNAGMTANDTNRRSDVFALDVDSGVIAVLTQTWWCTPHRYARWNCVVAPLALSDDGRRVLVARTVLGPGPSFDQTSAVFVATR